MRALNTRGQGMVEFSLVFLAFAVLFLALGEMGWIAYNWLGMEYSSNRGIRAAKMLPTDMDNELKANAIRQEMIQTANALGVTLNEGDIIVTSTQETITVDSSTTVTLDPFTGLLLNLGGDHSGDYIIRAREVIHNGEL